MQKFISKSLVFIFLTLLFCIIILSLNSYTNYKDKKLTYLQQFAPKELKVLVLGSSRANHGINTSFFANNENAFNAGLDGHGIISNYFLLKVLTEYEKIKIDTVWLEIDEYSLNGSKGFSREFRDDFFYEYLNDKEIFNEIKTFRNPFFSYVLKVFPKSGTLFYSSFSQFFSKYSFTFSKTYTKIPEIKELAKTRGYEPLFNSEPIDSEPKQTYILEPQDVKYLNKLLEYCKQKNIKIFFFRTPVLYCKHDESRLFDNYIDTLSKNHNIPFFDYKCDYQIKEWYYNRTHSIDTIAHLITNDMITKISQIQ